MYHGMALVDYRRMAKEWQEALKVQAEQREKELEKLPKNMPCHFNRIDLGQFSGSGNQNPRNYQNHQGCAQN
jgi:hypothetical protein